MLIMALMISVTIDDHAKDGGPGAVSSSCSFDHDLLQH